MKIILNWAYFIGTMLQTLSRAAMKAMPAYEKLVEANKKDTYIEGLEKEE